MKFFGLSVSCILVLFLFIISTSSFGYNVEQLNAFYQNGQVFLTWQNPAATNLKYKVYRSSSPIVSSTQLTADLYLGYVRDNSAKNMRKSQIEDENIYFIISPNLPPLDGDQGLYVATSTENNLSYYAVTVTTLFDNQEDLSVVPGSNSLVIPISETIAQPQAVLQAITIQGDTSYEYVIWGNNQDAPHWPAFNHAGSYGYNFTIQQRGNSLGHGLYVEFQDQNPFKKMGSEFCSDCNILQLDDWLPNGESTFWVGYNDSYDMYLPNNINPIVTTGTVKTFTQEISKAIIRWSKRQSGIDSTRIYMHGKSHNGFGCMLTAMNMTSEVACIYPELLNILYKTKTGDLREHQFCKATSNIPTDVYYPGTSDPMLIWDFCDLRTFLRTNELTGIPFAQGINGKNDTKAGWPQQFYWYDTINAYRHGGVWFWDQRTHSGDNAQFTNAETTPVYTRYKSDLSYPAFSNCSINQNPGNGTTTNGDPYGALNGYLDWDNNSISDETCSYSIKCFVKDFYAVGQLDPKQYDSCYTDITLRRTQHFHPITGQTIIWANYDENNALVQSDSFIYDGSLVTLYGIKIKKSGSTITLNISGCEMTGGLSNVAGEADHDLTVYPNPVSGSSTISFSLLHSQHASLKIYDVTGRLVEVISEKIMNGGQHLLQWSANDNNGNAVMNGFYLLMLETGLHSQTVSFSIIR